MKILFEKVSYLQSEVSAEKQLYNHFQETFGIKFSVVILMYSSYLFSERKTHMLGIVSNLFVKLCMNRLISKRDLERVKLILGLKTMTPLHFSCNYITKPQKYKQNDFHLLAEYNFSLETKVLQVSSHSLQNNFHLFLG